MAITEKAKDLIGKAKKYWKNPPQGRYMTYKEIISLATGGIGVRFVVSCFGQMNISIGNALIGNTIGISPSNIYIIYILSLLSSFPLTALRANMIDNSRNMKGKYRPYILTMGIPTVLLGTGFILMPYERMSSFTQCAVVLAFNVGFQFFYNFYFDAYDSLINVLSPNSIERSDVLSVRSVIENIAPSLYNIAFPLLAKLITGQNTLYDLKIYRLLFPLMLIFGFLLSMLVYVNTEEKVVRAKTHFVQVKFVDAFRAVARNKYFWVISLAGWLGFLETAFSTILSWMYNYQGACTAAQYSLVVAISGNASFWPNLFAPIMIRKYGKKKILVYTNLLNIVFIAVMLPVVRRTGGGSAIWLMLLCNFVNQFISALGHQLAPSVNADIRDYQQYISGERIDGMFAAVGLIGNVVTMVTGLVLPEIYKRSGLNVETAKMLGYDGKNVYDVLFDPGYFSKICSVLVIASVIGAALNVIPYFFYDFTETRQKSIVRVLKIRAAFEDFANGAASEEVLAEANEMIAKAEEYCDKQPADLEKAKLEYKAAKGKENYKQLKKEYQALRENNEEIEIAKFIIDELHRYSSPLGAPVLENAKKICALGLDGFLDVELPSKEQIKAMPAATPEEKELRSSLLSAARDLNTARKAAQKYFPDGIKEFDTSVLEKLFEQEDETERRLFEVSSRMKKAKEEKDTLAIADINAELNNIRGEKARIKAEIKKATAENSIFHRAAKPFLDAQKTVSIAQSYKRLDEFKALAAESRAQE